jgi:hypothetical protein
MTKFTWIQRSIPLAAAALVGAAPVVLAQGQQIFEWNGRVDREVQIFMRGNQVWTQKVGMTEPDWSRGRAMGGGLPRQNGVVRVQVLQGRGDVAVIQQPNAQNGFTSIVRVTDPRSGSDPYQLVGYWEGYSNGEYVGWPGRGRGRDRDNPDNNGGYGDRGNGRYGDRDNGRYGNRTMLHWSGNVDDQVEVRIQNGRVVSRTLSGKNLMNERVDAGNMDMPRGNANVTVVQNSGRGSVTVVQQPSSWNSYTTVIRIRDPQGGYGYYDFDLMWQ